jgi:hypothetical protein
VRLGGVKVFRFDHRASFSIATCHPRDLDSHFDALAFASVTASIALKKEGIVGGIDM